MLGSVHSVVSGMMISGMHNVIGFTIFLRYFRSCFNFVFPSKVVLDKFIDSSLSNRLFDPFKSIKLIKISYM